MPTQLEAAREVSDERVVMALVDVLFLLVGAFYGARVLAPLPKTYLSEIAFPFDVRTCHRCNDCRYACVLHRY